MFWVVLLFPFDRSFRLSRKNLFPTIPNNSQHKIWILEALDKGNFNLYAQAFVWVLHLD